MTEVEWLKSEDWRQVLTLFSGAVTPRKAMLYVCAGLRCIWNLLYDDSSRRAVEVAERAADGTVSAEEIDHAAWCAEVPTFGYDFEGETVRMFLAEEEGYRTTFRRLIEMGVYSEESIQINGPLCAEQVRLRLCNAAHIAYHLLNPNMIEQGVLYEHLLDHLTEQKEWPGAWLVREIFGNPFCPVVADSASLRWNGGTVVRLAQAAYDERQLPTGMLDHDRLAILADALEEAGCADARLLEHLRGPGRHVRGCWTVDALLGKS